MDKGSASKTNDFFDLCPEAAVIYTKESVIMVNNALLSLLGYTSKDEIVGKQVTDLVHRDYRSIITDRYKNMEEFPRVVESVLVTKQGKEIDVEVLAEAINYEGKSVYYSCLRDISSKRKYERELKKSEELKIRYEENKVKLEEAMEYDKLKTEFFSNISHELRTPINVILGAAQMSNIVMGESKREGYNKKLTKYLEIIIQNCLRLIRMTNNLIDITRIDYGFFNMKFIKGNIINAIENITMSVSQYAEHKGIQLIFDTDVEERMLVFDYEKLERILLNLLSNAVKFTDRGGFIYVTIKNHQEDISISVKDTGIGIPTDMHKMIFKRFVQVDKSFTRSNEGSGIGLALVKSIVDMCKGKIELISSPGQGSEFIVTLPAYTSENIQYTYCCSTGNHDCIEKAKVEFSDIYF